MEQLTNKELLRIFAAYMPCKTMWGDNHHHVLTGISIIKKLAELTLGFNSKRTCTADARVDEFKLILTPLSEISNEHKIELCTIRFKGAKVIGNAKQISMITEFIRIDAIKDSESVDRLRELGYDIGYGSIPSLIAAGIAVKKEKV